MTDMPDWRRWAESAHRDSLRSHPRRKKSKNCRYRCTACDHRTTHNQAVKTGFDCARCRQPLRAKEHELLKLKKLKEIFDVAV